MRDDETITKANARRYNDGDASEETRRAMRDDETMMRANDEGRMRRGDAVAAMRKRRRDERCETTKR